MITLYTPDELLIVVDDVDSLRNVDVVTNFLHGLNDRLYKFGHKPPFRYLLTGWATLVETNYGLLKPGFPLLDGKICRKSSGVTFLYKMICSLEEIEKMVEAVIKILKKNKHIGHFNVYIGKDLESLNHIF